MLKFIRHLLIFLILLVLFGELFFRFVIPAATIPFAAQDPEYGVMYYDTSKTRDGLYTSGDLAGIKIPWHVNNYGFLADEDYSPSSEKTKPRIAVIGDSYIIGMLVNWDEHVASVLEDKLNGEYDVYSLGTDMGTLVQYSQVVDYASHHFNPDIFVFCLNSGDVESSVLNYGDFFPPNVKLNYSNERFGLVAGTLYQPDKKKRILRSSAIIRYLWINKILQLLKVGRVDVNANPENLPDMIDSEKAGILQAAADHIIQNMAISYPDKKFLFVIDGYRYGIYENPDEMVYLPVSKYIGNVNPLDNVYSLDLTKMFYEDYRFNGKRFDWQHDYHWNAYAHSLVANAIYDIMINKIIEADNTLFLNSP